MNAARRWGHCVLASTLLAGIEPAWAQEEQAPKATALSANGLRFTAAAECADETAFVLRVRGYTAKAAFDERNAARTFVVTIVKGANVYEGQLEIVGNTEGGSRRVSGERCGEVLDALALMTALAIDPEALGPTTPEPEPEPAPRRPATQAKPIERKNEPKQKPLPRDSAQWSLGAQGWGTTGVLPQVGFGAGLLAGVRTSQRQAVRPSFALGVHYLTHADRAERQATVGYAALGTNAQGCVEFLLHKSWVPAACVQVLVGRLKSEVAEPQAAASTGSRTWAGLLLGPRLDYQPAAWWALRLEVMPGLHLIEHQVRLLSIEPNGTARETVLHETQGLIGAATLGALFHL